MEAKFKKGQSVRITKRNGEVIDGVIRDWVEKPLNFDPFGHARFAHLFVLYD